MKRASSDMRRTPLAAEEGEEMARRTEKRKEKEKVLCGYCARANEPKAQSIVRFCDGWSTGAPPAANP